jgi:hypothetical protein
MKILLSLKMNLIKSRGKNNIQQLWGVTVLTLRQMDSNFGMVDNHLVTMKSIVIMTPKNIALSG